MNRIEKIKLLTAIKDGVPLKFAFGERAEIYNTTFEPDVYYNELFEIVNLEQYKKQYKNISYFTTPDIENIYKLCKIHQKINLDNKEITGVQYDKNIEIIEKNNEPRKNMKNYKWVCTYS